MKKYFRLFLSLAKIATKRYLENRVNAYSGIISSLFYFLVTIFFVSIIFTKTPSIQGWSKYEALFLLGIFKVMFSIFSLLVLRGINFIPRYIQEGSLDLLLTKPLNSQFFLSFRYTRFWEVFSVFSAFVLVVFAANNLNFYFSFLNLIIFGANLIAGLIILYSIYFSISTLSVWMGRFHAFSSLSEILSSPLSYPMDILGKNISNILSFIIPLGFIITIPVKVFLDKLPIYVSLMGFLFALFLFTFCIWFWNFSLKHYTSASS